MDQPGFPLLWDEDRQQQHTPERGAISASFPEQDFRYGGQPRGPGGPVLNPGASQPHASFQFQQQALPQYLERQSHLNLSRSYPQAFLSRYLTSNSPLARIFNHPEVRIHRDSICFYLHLPPSLYAELYKTQSRLPVYQELTAFLAQKYGEPPPDLWALIHQLREQPDFPHAQAYLIDAIVTRVPQQIPPQTPGGSSARERRSYGGEPTLNPSEETSPIVVHIHSPTPGQAQTTATTPLSVGNARSTSQSPYQRTRGRAPRGERYKCPYTNCKHEPFKNAGNFNNHMRSCHFESPYRNQHPSNFLMPDVSPQPSIQGDGTSSAATNASDSPVNYRRQSQEFGNADLAAAFGRDRFASVGEGAYPPSIDDEFQASMVPGQTAYPQEAASVTSRLANSSIQNSISDDTLPDISPFSDEEAGHVGFGDFQRLEERLWDERMKK